SREDAKQCFDEDVLPLGMQEGPYKCPLCGYDQLTEDDLYVSLAYDLGRKTWPLIAAPISPGGRTFHCIIRITSAKLELVAPSATERCTIWLFTCATDTGPSAAERWKATTSWRRPHYTPLRSSFVATRQQV